MKVFAHSLVRTWGRLETTARQLSTYSVVESVAMTTTSSRKFIVLL